MDTQIGTNRIDALVYTYPVNTNRLSGVVDNTNNSSGFIDGNKNGDDYGYDVNGNMTSDKNKNITNIQYNHLNLPKKITFGKNGTIDYIYNAAGEKLEKIVKDALLTIYTNYLGGFQYSYVENQGNQGGGGDSPIPDDQQDPEPPYGFEPVPVPPVETSRFSGQRGLANNQEVPTRPTLQFFPTAEGYFDNINQKYVFQYKDHLGNVRVSYARNPITNVLEIIEENSYYPFGLKHQGYNTDSKQIGYNYKYNGKELQVELQFNVYDYGARNYDPAIGRWMNIDPLAEKGRRWSPYNYAMDNPVYFIDPDGMWPWPSWSGVKQFASGFGSSVMAMAQGAQLHNQVIGQVKLAYNVGKSAVNGDFRGAGNQLLNSTGIPTAVNTVKAASRGDAKALGEVAGVIATLAVVHKAGSASSAVASESNIFSSVKAEAIRVNPNANIATLEPGPSAGSSIPARNTSQSFNVAERSVINEIGSTEGCHTCGATSSGRASGNFTPDHQPVSSLVPEGTSQNLYPHCESCSASQGGTASSLIRKGYDKNNIK